MSHHPLAQTLQRARALSDYLNAELGPPSGTGWVAADGALRPAAPLLSQLAAATRSRLRTTGATTVASAMVQSYQWPLISIAIACFLLDQRVPDVSVANTWLHYNGENEADGLALRVGTFRALPDDPAASHPDAVVVPDMAALREALRSGLEQHLAQVISQLCTGLGCKPRGLWLNVSDTCASTLVWLLQEQDKTITTAQIEHELDALIQVPGSPLATNKIGLIPLTYLDMRQVFLERATCCYWYKTEGGDYCSTCPHRTPDDRKERLLHSMAEQYATSVGQE
ncbi:MAG: (2Fe-2S)-binding protein [Chloroflexaceae bacterium]|jgi:hypothetical protein|nr:(2Fe-2S)-binding protein [Chloroflexaceae bacterium]